MKALKPIRGNRIMSVEEAMKIVEGIPDAQRTTKRKCTYRLTDTLPYHVCYQNLLEKITEHELPYHPMVSYLPSERVFRPLTVGETMQARLENFEWINDKGRTRTIKERISLFEAFLATSSVIAYSNNAQEFAIFKESNWILDPPQSGEHYYPFNFEGLNNDVIVYSSDDVLSKNRNKPKWNQLWKNLAGDPILLRDYASCVKKNFNSELYFPIGHHQRSKLVPLYMEQSTFHGVNGTYEMDISAQMVVRI